MLGAPKAKKLSLTTKGTPANSPTSSPFLSLWSISLAFSNARSSVKLIKALYSCFSFAKDKAFLTSSSAVVLLFKISSLILKIFIIALYNTLGTLI